MRGNEFVGKVCKTVVAIYLAVAATTALAGRPLTTEDAGVIDKGGLELESYYYRQTDPQTHALSGFHLQPSVGIGFNTQLGIGVDFARQYRDDFEARKSAGAYSIVGKTSIKKLTDEAVGIALAYSVDRTRDVGERFRYDNASVNGALTVPVSSLLLHANIGWQRARLAAVTATTWALALEQPEAIGPVDLALETFGNDHEPAWVQVAARWALRKDKAFVDASYGVHTGSTRARQLTVGFKLAF